MTISSNFGSDITTIHQKRNLNENFSFNNTNSTACQMPVGKVVFEVLHSLTATAVVIQAVFFYLKFHSFGYFTLSEAELGVRFIRGNKPSNRTNNTSRSKTVVEALPRLLQVGKSLFTNFFENYPMLYKFLLLGDKRLTIRIRAHSEQEARQRLQLSRNAVLIARTKGVVYA